ncbi:MAG: hypothetical protein R3B49_03970 [Phycisphaerales bacterium]
MLARETTGDEGLPADQPLIEDRLETGESRMQLVEYLVKNGLIEPATEDGRYRPNSNVQFLALAEDRRQRGLA